jgi:hypothetical protein
MLIDAADLDFIGTRFHEVEGWCCDEAAYLTCCMLNCQAEAGLNGAMLEIGVYMGKYLSVLYQKALRTARPVVGIDTFQWSKRDQVLQTFTRLFGSTEGLTLVTASSLDYNPASLLELLEGRRPSFISVDGDHSAAAVRNDLFLAKGVLSDAGVIAVDDFLNPRAIGVSEGAYRYFLADDDQSLRPFAYCANKLFVADRKYHGLYRNAFSTLVSEMPELPMIQEFLRMQNMGQAYVEQQLLGSNVLII